MTTQELHIDLDLLLQKINSHYNQNILPQEKDMFLNREITRYITKNIDRLGNKKGTALFDTVKKTTDLSALLETKVLPVIYDNNSKEVSVALPFDYMYYINSEVSVCCTCTNKEQIDKQVYEIELNPLAINNYPFTLSQGIFSFTIEETEIPEDYLIQDTIPFYNNEILLINALKILIDKKNNLQIEVKYDKIKNKFIFRSSSTFYISYVSNNNTIVHNPILKTYKAYEDIVNPLYASVDIADEEFISNIKKSYLSGPKDEKAIVRLRDNRLLYTIKSSIADYVILTYLKKPRKIDVLLQSNSELSDIALEEIVSDTAQRIMGVIGSDNYAKYAQENILTE